MLGSTVAKESFAKQGACVMESTPETARRYMEELAKWRRVVRSSGIKTEAQ